MMGKKSVVLDCTILEIDYRCQIQRAGTYCDNGYF